MQMLKRLSFQSALRAGGVLIVALAGAAAAQDNTSLPGGATSLSETHDNWAVTCSLQTLNGKTGKACTLSQQLTDTKSRQRILAIELRPMGTGVEGTLVLPFGLALAKGAALQIDDGPVGTPMSFKTCLPVGCIVPVSFDARLVAALRNGKVLRVKTVRDGAGEMQISISLKGFGGALDRTATLLR